MYRIIAFYTDHPPQYTELADKFRQTCPDAIITKIPTLGNWRFNCYLKPYYILQMMEKYPKDTLVYTDIDSTITNVGEIESLVNEMDSDLLLAWWPKGWYLGGTMIIAPSAKDFVRYWFNLCLKVRCDLSADQKVLNQAVKTYPVSVKNLPANFVTLKHLDNNLNANVQHIQASRETRYIVQDSPDSPRPAGIRLLENGALTVPRKPTGEQKSWLEENCIPAVGYDNVWYPKSNAMESTDILWPWFRGKTVSIIGKGSSLDWLTDTNLTDTIIAINESIHRVEQVCTRNQLIAVIQQDEGLRDTCKPRDGLIITRSDTPFLYPGEPNRYAYDAVKMGLPNPHLTVEAVIALCKKWGVKKINLYCFDACTNGSLDYADCIGYPASYGGDIRRFKKHKTRIAEACGKLPFEFIKSSGPS